MSIERQISSSRLAFRDIQMPVRVVKDRPVGTFRHDVESLRENSFAIVTTGSQAEIGLISKARNYSATEFDVMLSFLNDDKSEIDKLPEEDRLAFFSTVAEVLERMDNISGLHLAVGFNQHPNGHRLPYKNELGQKNRVQTLQPLHVHIYETEIFPDGTRRMGNLDIEDQRDICDPLVLLSGEILMNELSQRELVANTATRMDLTITDPPLGLNIRFPVSLPNFLRENSGIISEVQSVVVETYGRFSTFFLDQESGELLPTADRTRKVKQFLAEDGQQFAPYSRKMLLTIAREMKGISGVPSYNIFIKGAAVTYTLTETEEGDTMFNIHPRLMSRGNSPDSYCIYVDNSETQSAETADDVNAKIVFYGRLVEQLSEGLNIRIGEFMNRKSTK